MFVVDKPNLAPTLKSYSVVKIYGYEKCLFFNTSSTFAGLGQILVIQASYRTICFTCRLLLFSTLTEAQVAPIVVLGVLSSLSSWLYVNCFLFLSIFVACPTLLVVATLGPLATRSDSTLRRCHNFPIPYNLLTRGFSRYFWTPPLL